MGGTTEYRKTDWRGACAAVLVVLASACSPPASEPAPAAQSAPTEAASSPQAESPPLVDGLYVVRGACPGEGCQLGAWTATKAGELRAQPDQNAPVVARVTEGEAVDAIGSELRLRPARGVVFRAGQNLAVGDVVYMLDSEGEGFFTLWRRGETLSWSWPSEIADTVDEETGIHWDRTNAEWRTPPPPGPLEGWWVQIRGAQGQTGWSRASDGFECRPVANDPTHCQLM